MHRPYSDDSKGEDTVASRKGELDVGLEREDDVGELRFVDSGDISISPGGVGECSPLLLRVDGGDGD